MKYKFYALWMCAIMIVVFLFQLFVNGFTDALILNDEAYSQIWRFITALFLHGGAGHLLYNIFALALFGSMLEKLVGGRKFLLIFFLTGIVANLIAVNFYSSSLGASGAIFGIIGALIVIRPGLPIFAFGIPMPIFLAGIIWAAGDLLGAAAYFVGNPINNTGNIAHLSGMVIGLFLGFFFKEKESFRDNRVRYRLNEHEVRRWEDDNL
ncbi:MAG: rhomboid family intramembrane serine protease [Nanoarchaeota archaeon]|nr:rhomboid family intramembrane serine protease [Nanoarchaeota archaeon]